MSRSPSSSPSTLTAALTAWQRGGGDPSAFANAVSALPPRVGGAGWPARWALAARAALRAAERAAAERAAAERAAERAALDASPVWGVIREYGVGFWSRSYFYEVRIGAGHLSREEAEAAKAAAYADDKTARFHRETWDDFMR
jgi:hypothetical protein